ncbi:MAG TPA: hypothetical protein VFN39_04135, partial [Gemmatimonadaceae bacterium]|nr:hypothetical protein [Gemmatimonadaceae bacterium]
MSAENAPLPERGTLPRELIDFLIELSIALQKFAIYPAGHPMLATTVERLERRLRPLLERRDSLSLGVARSQLVIEGVATEETHAVLRELAERLHHHHLGAVKINRQVTPAELREFLVIVGIDQGKDALPLGLQPIENVPQWANIRLYPLAYENLELLGEEESSADLQLAGAKTRADGARAARLWVGLARAALAGRGGAETRARVSKPAPVESAEVAEESGDAQGADLPESAAAAESAEAAAADPAAVAQAIDEHHREEAYDQVIVGYLLQIADELRTADGRDAVALRSRVSRLLGTIRPETLRNLLEMGNDVGQRQKFVLDATQGMAVDAVIELLRAAADVSHQTISHSMLRLLSKLAVHAERGAAERRVDADAALRENVRMLVGQWTLEDPNPDAYRSVLEGMSKARPRLDTTAAAAFPVEEQRLVQMALKIGVAGDSTWRAIETMIEKRQLPVLIGMLERGPRPTVAQRIWERVATPERVRALISEPQPDWQSLDRLVARVGLGAANALADALEDSEDQRRQGQIINLLAKLGDEVGAVIARRLPQSTPAVQAQLLLLL